jgi:hypothetical protein
MTEHDHRGGYAIAQGLGLDAFLDMSGDSGTAYFLEDGRVLKVTGEIQEAAVCLAIQEASCSVTRTPAFHASTRCSGFLSRWTCAMWDWGW